MYIIWVFSNEFNNMFTDKMKQQKNNKYNIGKQQIFYKVYEYNEKIESWTVSCCTSTNLFQCWQTARNTAASLAEIELLYGPHWRFDIGSSVPIGFLLVLFNFLSCDRQSWRAASFLSKNIAQCIIIVMECCIIRYGTFASSNICQIMAR